MFSHFNLLKETNSDDRNDDDNDDGNSRRMSFQHFNFISQFSSFVCRNNLCKVDVFLCVLGYECNWIGY